MPENFKNILPCTELLARVVEENDRGVSVSIYSSRSTKLNSSHAPTRIMVSPICEILESISIPPCGSLISN